MSTDEPTPRRPATRFRCAACGNLTRFDVVATSTVRSFFHFTVGGDLTEEDRAVLDETVDSVTCRWCGPRGEVVQIANDGAAPVPPDADETPPGP